MDSLKLSGGWAIFLRHYGAFGDGVYCKMQIAKWAGTYQPQKNVVP